MLASGPEMLVQASRVKGQGASGDRKRARTLGKQLTKRKQAGAILKALKPAF